VACWSVVSADEIAGGIAAAQAGGFTGDPSGPIAPRCAFNTFQIDHNCNQEAVMRAFLGFAIGVAFGVGGLTLAGDRGHGKVKVTTISARDVAERVDGKQARVTTLEVTIPPGQASTPHRHPGAVFGYVLEGDYEWAINDQPVKTLKAGDTFYEPTMSLHRVSRNPNAKTRTRLLAVLLHPRDAKQLAIPEPVKKD
jgi:quercetin dioxygenase-like cupin family protein